MGFDLGKTSTAYIYEGSKLIEGVMTIKSIYHFYNFIFSIPFPTFMLFLY
jgi:hypothetical protein